MTIRQIPLSADKYSIKCPYTMDAQCIVIHNTANDASAENEIRYMQSNNDEVSFHIAVDDTEAVQGIPLDRIAWHAGDGENGVGNRTGIAVEICYSKSGGERFTKAEQNAAALTAQLLTQRGWGIDRVKKHQDFSGKYCPHRTLDMGWDRFLDMVWAEMNKPEKEGDTMDNQENTANRTDSEPQEWAKDAVEWAMKNGIILGDENDALMLRETCTREMVLVFLYRAMKAIGKA